MSFGDLTFLFTKVLRLAHKPALLCLLYVWLFLLSQTYVTAIQVRDLPHPPPPPKQKGGGGITFRILTVTRTHTVFRNPVSALLNM